MTVSTDLIPKWPRIRENLERWRSEIGYVTLQTYFLDRAGSQVARLNMEEKMLQYWLEYGPDHESDEEERVNSTLDRLSRGIPTGVPDDDFNLDAGKEKDADESEDEGEDDAFDLDAAFAALEEDDEPEAEDLDEEGDDDADEPEEEEPEEKEPEAVPLSAEECVIAIRKWLLASCENNCPTGQQQQFRIRLYAPKGRQLWSKLFGYRSSTAPMAVDPVQPFQPQLPHPEPTSPIAFAIPSDDEPIYAPPPTPPQATRQHAPMFAGDGYPGQPPLHPDPARIQELYSMDPQQPGNNNGAGGIPAMNIPSTAQMERTAIATAHPNGGAEGIAQLSPQTLAKLSPDELALLIGMMQNVGHGPQFPRRNAASTPRALSGLWRVGVQYLPRSYDGLPEDAGPVDECAGGFAQPQR